MWILRGGVGRAHVIPKISEKCSFILNSMKMNGSDSCPPPRFVLPQLEQLRDCSFLRKKGRVYMIKFDVSNGYWSIVLMSGAKFFLWMYLMRKLCGVHSCSARSIRW